MENDDKALYEVRYPNGDTVRMFAHQIYYTDVGVSLVDRDAPGRTVFYASHGAGVTLCQVDGITSLYPGESDRLCGCGGVGDHGVDHDD